MANEIRYTVAKVTTARPSMNRPTIKISSESLSIEDTLNGSFLGGYKIYCDGNYLASVGPVKSVDLGQFEYPSITTYKITIKAFSDYFNDSPASNEVLFSMKGYDKIENELGTTAKIMSSYRITPGTWIKGAETLTMI